MIELVNRNDSVAVRNKDNILACYEEMINQKNAVEAVAKYISPAYVQHNPLIPDGPEALGAFFAQAVEAHTKGVVSRSTQAAARM